MKTTATSVRDLEGGAASLIGWTALACERCRGIALVVHVDRIDEPVEPERIVALAVFAIEHASHGLKQMIIGEELS